MANRKEDLEKLSFLFSQKQDNRPEIKVHIATIIAKMHIFKFIDSLSEKHRDRLFYHVSFKLYTDDEILALNDISGNDLINELVEIIAHKQDNTLSFNGMIDKIIEELHDFITASISVDLNKLKGRVEKLKLKKIMYYEK